MAKDSFWFKHDYNARNDEKILELRSEFGAEGYGIYWMLVETMAETDSGGAKASLIGGLSHGYGVAKQRLSEIINYCLSVELLYEKDGFYFSKRLDKHKIERKEFSIKGSEGAEKRWAKNRGAIGGAMQRRGEEKREEKKREEIVGFVENKKGVKFDDDFEFVFFDDGSKQKLGSDQKALAKLGKTKPHLIVKGSIY